MLLHLGHVLATGTALLRKKRKEEKTKCSLSLVVVVLLNIYDYEYTARDFNFASGIPLML